MRTRRLAGARLGVIALALAIPAVAFAQDENPNGDDPHGGAAGMQPGMFEPPADAPSEDPNIPAGTIAITLLDADNKPVQQTNVLLGIIHQSVAKGESREHKNALSDADGRVQFDHLETGSGIAYRVSVAREAATFAATPFGLSPMRGMRVPLHVYQVTHDINEARIVMQAIVYAEMRDDRVQIQQALTIYNFARVAWLPDNVMLGLPENFTAFNVNQEMSDVGLDAIEKRGARLRGTFGPGQHSIEFRWQLPYSNEPEIAIDEALPPHVAIARVMAAASQQMRLVVDGFPDAQAQQDNQGQRILLTEKQVRREEGSLSRVRIALRDLPTPGPARNIATGLAGLTVLLGIGLAVRSATERAQGAAKGARKGEAKAERAQLLAELEELEREHRSGEVGPKTYERARRELIDAIARTLAPQTAAKA